MGIVIAVVIAAVIGLIAFAVAAISRREPRKPMTPDDQFNLGVVFLGAGVAMFVTLGPAMVWMPILGAIMMASASRKKRESS